MLLIQDLDKLKEEIQGARGAAGPGSASHQQGELQ